MRKKVVEMLRDIIDVLGKDDDAEIMRRLELIEKRLDALEQPKITINPQPWVPSLLPSPWMVGGCPMGGEHEFPSPWLGINPPPCNKCGGPFGLAPVRITWTMTSTNSAINLKS